MLGTALSAYIRFADYQYFETISSLKNKGEKEETMKLFFAALACTLMIMAVFEGASADGGCPRPTDGIYVSPDQQYFNMGSTCTVSYPHPQPSRGKLCYNGIWHNLA